MLGLLAENPEFRILLLNLASEEIGGNIILTFYTTIRVYQFRP